MVKAESFGSRLAATRKSCGFTQEELAERLNISPQAVSKWENDLTSPDLDTLSRIAEIFDISTDTLLGRVKKETRMVEAGKRKDPDQIFLRIKVNTNTGDKVMLNLPVMLVKAFKDSNDPGNLTVGNYSLTNIDWDQILTLVDQGVMGELISVESADGDLVSIWVE